METSMITTSESNHKFSYHQPCSSDPALPNENKRARSVFPILSSTSTLPGNFQSYQSRYQQNYQEPYPLRSDQSKEIHSSSSTSPLTQQQKFLLPKNLIINSSPKRIKTSRACDSCRTKKIRCEPIGANYFKDKSSRNSSSSDVPKTCLHCYTHSIDCTWYLPISETRFKCKEQTGSQQWIPNNSSPDSNLKQTKLSKSNLSLSESLIQKRKIAEPSSNHSGSSTTSLSPLSRCTPPLNSPKQHENLNLGVSKSTWYPKSHIILGPSSMSYLLQSTSDISRDKIAKYESKYSQSFEKTDVKDGFVRECEKEPSMSHSNSVVRSQEETGEKGYQGFQDRVLDNNDHGKISFSDLKKSSNLTTDEFDDLIGYFFQNVFPFCPFISEIEYLRLTNSPSNSICSTLKIRHVSVVLIVYSICCMSSLNHQIKDETRIKLRDQFMSFQKSSEILSQGDLMMILSLCICGMSICFESSKGVNSTWNSIGMAIRMAQGLGLHCTKSSGGDSNDMNEYLRRKVWWCCLISDRWISAMYGLPLAIDLEDCYKSDEINSMEKLRFSKESPHFETHFGLLKLSILLGKVLKLIYLPKLKTKFLEKKKKELDDELTEWRNYIETLKERDFNGYSYLILASVSVNFLLNKPSFLILKDEELKLDFEKRKIIFEEFLKVKGNLFIDSYESIEWVAQNLSVVESIVIGKYSLFICSFIQYLSCIFLRNEKSLKALEKAKSLLEVIQRKDCVARKRMLDAINVLYYTAKSAMNNKRQISTRDNSSSLSSPPTLSDSQTSPNSIKNLILTTNFKGKEVEKEVEEFSIDFFKEDNSINIDKSGCSSDKNNIDDVRYGYNQLMDDLFKQNYNYYSESQNYDYLQQEGRYKEDDLTLNDDFKFYSFNSLDVFGHPFNNQTINEFFN